MNLVMNLVYVRPQKLVPPTKGMEHYAEKANSYFSKSGEVTSTQFEKEIREFEAAYFKDLPQMVMITTDMLCPAAERAMWLFNTFSK